MLVELKVIQEPNKSNTVWSFPHDPDHIIEILSVLSSNTFYKGLTEPSNSNAVMLRSTPHPITKTSSEIDNMKLRNLQLTLKKKKNF